MPRLEPVIKTVLFAIAMLFLLSYFDLSFRHLLCRRLTRPWFGMVFLNQFEIFQASRRSQLNQPHEYLLRLAATHRKHRGPLTDCRFVVRR